MTLLVVAICGASLSLVAVMRFLWIIVDNGLMWTPRLSPRELYLAVGNSYSLGFATGFSLAFFLSLAAIAVGSWTRNDRPGRRRRFI
jgi:hypothetical protein